MRHLHAVPAALLAALTLGACAGEDEVPELDESAMDAQVETDGTTGPAFSEEVRTAFQPPEGSDTGVRGTMRLLVPTQEMDEDRPMRLRVELAGLGAGPHAWHVHEGPCGVDAPIIVPLSAADDADALAEPLVAGADGTSSAEVDVPPLSQMWVEAGALSVHVHETTAPDHGPTVACATL